MATTTELREIIEELELVDIGDAASYLGEEGEPGGHCPAAEKAALLCMDDSTKFYPLMSMSGAE